MSRGPFHLLFQHFYCDRIGLFMDLKKKIEIILRDDRASKLQGETKRLKSGL